MWQEILAFEDPKNPHHIGVVPYRLSATVAARLQLKVDRSVLSFLEIGPNDTHLVKNKGSDYIYGIGFFLIPSVIGGYIQGIKVAKYCIHYPQNTEFTLFTLLDIFVIFDWNAPPLSGRGGVKGYSTKNDITLSGSPALWAGSFIHKLPLRWL